MLGRRDRAGGASLEIRRTARRLNEAAGDGRFVTGSAGRRPDLVYTRSRPPPTAAPMNAPTSSALAAGLSLNHDLIDDFLAEWDQASQAVSATLLEMESAPDRESLRALFRHLHSMKSNLRMVELPDLSAVVHALEDLTEALQSGRIAFETVFGDLILLIIQLLRESSERRLLGGLPSDALATTLIPMLTAMQQIGGASKYASAELRGAASSCRRP